MVFFRADISQLHAAIRSQSQDPSHDHNEDGQVNALDVTALLSQAGTVTGDADFDGDVDFVDFVLLSMNFGKEDAGFADGDFDGNGEVSFPDFLLLTTNFGFGTEEAE